MKYSKEDIIHDIAIDWSMRFPKGYYEESDPNKLVYLKESLLSNKFDKELIDEVISSFISSLYNKIKKFLISTVFPIIDSILNTNLSTLTMEEDPISIIIPSETIKSSSLKEGAKESIKGNYNEALVCKYIADKNKVPINIILKEDISKNNKSIVYLNQHGLNVKEQIEVIVKKWDDDLKRAAKHEYEEIYNSIKLASDDMAKYILKNAYNNNSIIVAIELDNLSFQEGSEFKADIKITFEKEDRQLIEKFSLKIYSGYNINLSNSTFSSLINKITSTPISSELKAQIDLIKKDSFDMNKLKQFFKDLYKKIETDEPVEKIKKFISQSFISKKEPEITDQILDFCNKLTEKNKTQILEEIEELEKSSEIVRSEYRTVANVKLAELVYNELNKFIHESEENERLFCENLLKDLGFLDTETKVLLSIIKKSKNPEKTSVLLDKLPELDLSSIELIYKGGVRISVINKITRKTMVTLSVKEAEKMAAWVDFSSVAPVDKSKLEETSNEEL